MIGRFGINPTGLLLKLGVLLPAAPPRSAVSIIADPILGIIGGGIIGGGAPAGNRSPVGGPNGEPFGPARGGPFGPAPPGPARGGPFGPGPPADVEDPF